MHRAIGYPRSRMKHGSVVVAVLASMSAFAPDLPAQNANNERATGPADASLKFECGYRSPAQWLADLSAAVDRGEIPDPAQRLIPPIAPRTLRTQSNRAPCLSPAHIFPFEDSDQVLLTDFSSAQFIDLIIAAANELLSVQGDNYDFVGIWINFTPHHTIGTALYKFIENDVLGIGDASTTGTPLFNLRPTLGLGGVNIEGFVVMWNINSSQWQPGDGPGANFTRLALGQEYEHRFAMFLPDLLHGRRLQGNNDSCGRKFHWNWRVDGQGSSMEIREWVGSSPAALVGGSITFNTDIGGIFSYTDLYLMGYISAQEMDAGNSELRYMIGSDCSPFHSGSITHFSSADIIATAGPRVPSHEQEDKHYRTGWIMIHRPGDPPSATELNKAVAIHEQHMIDWNAGTLGRGTMDNSLFDDCNCNDVPDALDISDETSPDLNENGVPDECDCAADLDGDGPVRVPDLIILLAAWGPNAGHPADLDGDGEVGVPDLIILLSAWGPCR